MSLKSQRRLAAAILGIGVNRVWIDPEKLEDVEVAITRDEIKKLIHEGVIKGSPEKSQSRYRAKLIRSKKASGRRRGSGTKKGSAYATISRKRVWMVRIRSLRNRLRLLKNRRIITVTSYRTLYRKAKGGEFKSVSELERYLVEQGLRRRVFG